MKFELEGNSESPWGAESPDKDEYALLNHAINFLPFYSWGAIFDSKTVDVTSYWESMELTLHPEAFDQYVASEIIDEEGNLLAEVESFFEEDEDEDQDLYEN